MSDLQPARVCVVVTCSAPHGDPDDMAAAIAHAVRRVAPGAHVFHTTPEEPSAKPSWDVYPDPPLSPAKPHVSLEEHRQMAAEYAKAQREKS
ncbi:hypothetical protein [Nocardiopsis synnemataformans]|uniref:hypothetical protein n=1 Tax=Nocardiopsis synnemataformans TaxID=61305 RepID=UPI003EB92AC3